jgi:hypothetical protein
LFGEDGNDELHDYYGADLLDGGSGTDTFYVDLGRGFSTADQIVGGAEHDTLYIVGGSHADWLDFANFSIIGIESFVSLTGSFRMSVEEASSFPRIEVWGLELTNGGTLIAGENFKVWDIRLNDAGNNLDLSLAAPLNYVVTGGNGDDAITSSGLGDMIAGGGGADVIRGSVSQLNGDTIIGFDRGDVLLFTDASLDGFTFSLADHTLYFSGGSLTLSESGSGSLLASAAPNGGVQIRMGPLDDYDAQDDFNGDGRSDLFWRNGAGTASDWLGQANGGFVGNGASSLAVGADWHVQGYGDFNGDGRDDVLWRNDGGTVADWFGQKDGRFVGNGGLYMTVSDEWHIVGTGDFNGDGKDDVLWRGNNGIVTDWLGQSDGTFFSNNGSVFNPAGLDWHIVGTGDFNGDGRDDVLWRNDAGTIANWLGQPDGGFIGNPNFYATLSNDWQIVGVGDFNGDGGDDIALRHSDGTVTDWLGQVDGGLSSNIAHANSMVGLDWHVSGIGDYNGDGRDDILWRHISGTITDWLGQKDGGFVGNGDNLYTPVGTDWHVQPQDILVL